METVVWTERKQPCKKKKVLHTGVLRRIKIAPCRVYIDVAGTISLFSNFKLPSIVIQSIEIGGVKGYKAGNRNLPLCPRLIPFSLLDILSSEHTPSHINTHTHYT